MKIKKRKKYIYGNHPPSATAMAVRGNEYKTIFLLLWIHFVRDKGVSAGAVPSDILGDDYHHRH